MTTTTPDQIRLSGLSARGYHGVLPFERTEGQLFTADVTLDLGERGTAVASVTDAVKDAVDYSEVARAVVAVIEGEPVSLIETLAARVGEAVLAFPRVTAVEVTIHKPQAPLDVAFEDVSVTIHRVADAAAGHGGAPATSQAAWAAQAEAPVAVSAQPYASPSSSASPVAAASPAAPAYEPPAAPAAPIVSEVPDFSGASFTGGDAAPAALASEVPITPTPSPASPMEAPARSPFAAAAPSVPTPMPTEPGTPGGSAESTQPWVPDWATESADSSASSAPAWTPEAPEAPEATGLPSGESAGESADSYSASSALDAPSTSAPTAASASRTAGADGFVSLAAEALGAAPASSEPEPSALSYAEEVAADAAAAASSEPAPAADGLAVQLPHEGRHVASSEEGEDQSAPAVEGSADLLGGPVAFDESGSYSGAASSQASDAGAAPEAAGADASGFAFPALGGDATASETADADGLMGASSVPASQPLGEPGPSPFAVPGELPGAAGQEGVAPASSEPSYSQPSVSEDFSQPAEGSYAAPSAQPDFLGAPGAAPAPTAPEAPAAAPAAPVDPLSERPTRPVGVVFGLGANVGGVVDSLRTAVQSLKATEGIEVTQVAPLARTIAVVAEGAEPQPDYLNTVVTAMTTLAPRELLEVCQTLEIAAGRVRTEPWGVRTLDVDLIEVEGVTSSDPALSLPHPRAAERAFVLVPWSQADPFAELAGRSVSELAESAPDRGGLRWLAFDWLDSESLPDKPTGPYVEPPVEQDAAGSEPGLVYDATRDESSVADASLAADYAGSIAEASSAAPEPAPAQPLGDQGQAESSPFGQLPFDTSNGAGSWAEQAPQVDSPYQAASAPEAAGPQGSYAPGLSAGPDGVSHGQQDEAAGDAWKSPLQWNDVIGGGAQGTGPRQDV